jgi:hypothetical protein
LFDFLLDLLRNDETEADPEIDDDVRVRRDDAVTEESSVAISGDRDDDDDDCIVSFFSQDSWSLGLSSTVSSGEVNDSSSTFFEPKNFTISLGRSSSCENALR